MESLACLKDHLEVTMSENKCLMAAVDEFASSLKSKSFGPSRQSSATLARQTDFFREQVKLLNRRIRENIASIDAVVGQSEKPPQDVVEAPKRKRRVVTPSKSFPQDANHVDDDAEGKEVKRKAGGLLELDASGHKHAVELKDAKVKRTFVADESEDTLEWEDGVVLDARKSSGHRGEPNAEAGGKGVKGDKIEADGNPNKVSRTEGNPDVAQILEDVGSKGSQELVSKSHGEELTLGLCRYDELGSEAIMKNLRLCRLEDVGNGAIIKDLRRATVLEAVEYLCEDEGDKQRILKHMKETDDECTLRMLEGVICKKYVEVRLLQDDMRRKEEETLLRRLMEEREKPTSASLAVCRAKERARKPTRRWEEPMELLEMDLPIIRGEILYLIDEFDVEVEKFRLTVSEIAKVHCALHEKNLEIHTIQERLFPSTDDGKKGGRPPKWKAKETHDVKREKKAVSYKDIEAEFRSKYGGGWSKVPSLLRAAKERNVRLQGLINDQSLKIRTMVAELGRVGTEDREEIETELRNVVKKLHGAMEVVYAKSDEASVRQYATLKKLEELHESQEELLKVLAVICENLDAGGDMEGDGAASEGEVKLDELRGEIEYLESEFRVKNARTLDLIDRYQGVLTENGAADSTVVSQVAYQANACIAVEAPAKLPAETSGFVSFRRRISVLTEETVGCKRGLLECIKQQEESDGSVKKLRQLVEDKPQEGGEAAAADKVVVDGEITAESEGRRLNCVLENQELEIELLERKLTEVVERNTKMAADVDDILAKRTRQVEDLGARLAEAECRLEKNRDVLEAVDFEEELDLEKILANSVKRARARLSRVLETFDSCLRRTAQMLEKTDEATQRGFLKETVKVLEVQQLFVNKKAHEFFMERKDNLYRQIVSKSSEFEEIHRELDEVRRAKVRLEGRGKGDVDELQRLLHEIKELKLQMLLNATLEKTVQLQPVGDVGQWLGQAEEQKEVLQGVAQSCKDFENFVSFIKDNLIEFQEELRVSHCEVRELHENLVQIILGEDDDGGSAPEPAEYCEAEVRDELVVRDLVTKILEDRVQKWQSGELLGGLPESPEKSRQVTEPLVVREIRKQASVSRVETWQRSGEESDPEPESKDYCHKVLEMCLKVDIMQDNILNRLESVSRDQPTDQQQQIGISVRERFRQQLCVWPEPAKRGGTRWINTDGLAAALFPPATSQQPPSGKVDAMSKQLAKYARQNTVLKALLRHSLTRAEIFQEALAKTKVTNVDALPRHKWLKENVLLRDLVAQLMDEVFFLQNRAMRL